MEVSYFNHLTGNNIPEKLGSEENLQVDSNESNPLTCRSPASAHWDLWSIQVISIQVLLNDLDEGKGKFQSSFHI